MDLDSCRALRESGHYAQAVSKFEQLSSKEQQNAYVCFELAETLMVQGYYRRSLQVLESYPTMENEPAEQMTYLLGMLKCCIACIVEGKFHQNVRQADDLYKAWRDDARSEEAIRESAIIEMYHCKILHLAGSVNQAEAYRNSSECFLPRLKLWFGRLTAGGYYSTRLNIALCYSRVCSSQVDFSMLTELIDDSTCPVLVRAKAQLALACFYDDAGNTVDRDTLYRQARGVLEKNHAHEDLDMRFRLACSGFGHITDQPIEQDFGSMLAQYEQLDYPAGVFGALNKLLHVAMIGYNFDLQVEVSSHCDKLSEEMGSFLLWAMTAIQVLAHWHLNFRNPGLVEQEAQKFYSQLDQYDCPYQQGHAAQILADGYIRQGNTSKAAEWSMRCYELWKTCANHVKSFAELTSMNAEFMQVTDQASALERLDKAERMIEADLNLGLTDNAMKKSSTVLVYLVKESSLGSSLKETRGKQLFERMERIAESNQETSSSLLAASLYADRALALMNEAESVRNTEKEDAALELQEQAIQIYRRVNRPEQLVSMILTRQQTGLALLSIYKKSLQMGWANSRQVLERTHRIFLVCEDSFKTIGTLGHLVDATYWPALTSYELWLRGWIDSKSVLDALLRFEKIIDLRRDEISSAHGLEALQAKQSLSSNKHFRDVYRFAFQVCWSERQLEASWIWTQKSKARSLSDSLGLGVIIPFDLMQQIIKNDKSKRLFEKESDILRKYSESNSLERLPLRVKLDALQAEMREVEALGELLAMRQGMPIGVADIQKALNNPNSGLSGREVTFIDWLIKGDELFMLSVRGLGRPMCRRLNASVSFLKAWVEQHLISSEGRALTLGADEELMSDRPLATLDCLVEFLEGETSPNSLLILSLTSFLHVIPVHALRLPLSKEPLITRNPVIYCANLTTFFQCCQRAQNTKPLTMQQKTFVAVYESASSHETFDTEERSKVYKSCEKLASSCAAEAFHGAAVTLDLCKQRLQASHLIHFHCHCDTATQSILDQSLRLYSEDSERTPRLAVRELFDLSLLAPHVSLLACGSARQQVNIGDEPLGLVTALLYAGASSVLGTNWPVASFAARKFSKYFYRSLGNTSGSGATFVNLAEATRDAILELRDDHRFSKPYYWAPFVLHGSWRSRCL